MAVYTRKLRKRERMILKQWLSSSDLQRFKRAQIILMSAAGKKTSEIAQWVNLNSDTVCRLIQVFNLYGIGGLEPRSRPGRPAKSNSQAQKRLLQLLKHSPEEFSVMKARWTLEDIADVFSSQNSLHVSYEWVRQQLDQLRYSFKCSKLRTFSQDPEYYEKKGL